MRRLVALWAAILGFVIVFASSERPVFAANAVDMPQVSFASEEPFPNSNVSAPFIAASSARARRSEGGDAGQALSIISTGSVNAELASTTVTGLAKAVAGISAEEKAAAAVTTFPSLNQFIASIKNEKSREITGIYVKDVMAVKVVPYPSGNPLSVTALPGYVTLSCGIEQCPSIGFLAHNFLAGALFSRMSPNQEVALVHGDGSTERFRVSAVKRFQALSPNDPYSEFLDLETGNQKLSSTDVFNQTFGVGHQVVFQTCISANGNLSWGRLFVIADPV